MSLAKLNARDVAKDFGMQAKAITAILTEHTKEAASPTKVLTDRELSIVFEHLTQNNQVDSIESIYADVYHEPAKAAAPAKGEPEAKPAAGKESAPAPQSQGQDKAALSPVIKKRKIKRMLYSPDPYTIGNKFIIGQFRPYDRLYGHIFLP